MLAERSLYKQNSGPIKGSDDLREIVLHPEHIDDLTLWKAFRSGNEKALVTIFERFTKPLFNYGYKIAGDRELVKDTIQELFIEIWQKRELLSDTDSIKYYLYRALRRRLARSLSSGSRIFTTASSEELNSELTPSAESILINEQIAKEQTERLSSMFDTLTKRQKEVMFLRYFDELSCDQIAMIMKLSKQAVYNLIHHSIQHLKKGAGL